MHNDHEDRDATWHSQEAVSNFRRKMPCDHAIGMVDMTGIDPEEAVPESISEAIRDTAREHHLVKGGFVRDYENYNVFHLETLRTGGKCLPVPSSVVDVTPPIINTLTVGLHVASIPDFNIRDECDKRGGVTEITVDCCFFCVAIQSKSRRQKAVRILQRERKTLQTRVGY
jgi:hypothetical protein